jgi:hypothetical protein
MLCCVRHWCRLCMQAAALEDQHAGGDSPVHSMLPDNNGDGAAQQQARGQRQDSPELLCTTRSQSGPADWESMMEWNDDGHVGRLEDAGMESKGSGGSREPASERQMPPPLPSLPQPQQQADQQQQQQAGPATSEPAAQQPAPPQRPPKQEAHPTPDPAPAAANSQQRAAGDVAGKVSPLPRAASAFRPPSVSTGAEAWRPSRVPSIRSGSALAGAWPQVAPVQSGNAGGAAVLWGGRQPAAAEDGGMAPAVAVVLRSVSAAAAAGPSAALGAGNSAVTASIVAAAGTAAAVRSLPVPGAGGYAGGGGSDLGGGKRRKRLHNPLHVTSCPPTQSLPTEAGKLLSVAEIDSLVAKYTAAAVAAPALGSGLGAAGKPAQVSGLRLCSAPVGLQVRLLDSSAWPDGPAGSSLALVAPP